MEKVVRWGVYAIALVPLIIFKDFLSPFHFGKVIILRAFVELLFVCYLLLIMRDRRFLPRTGALFWAVTIFTAIFGLTSLTSIYPYQSIMGTLERMGGWFTFLHFWAFFVMALGVLKTREHWFTLIKVSVFASLLSAFYGFLQKTDWSWIVGGGGRLRIFGTLGNTALFAGYMIVNVFFALMLMLRSRGAIKWYYGSVFALDVLAVIMTAVRGSVLGLLVSLALFSVLLMATVVPRWVKVSFGMLAALLILLELMLIAAHDTAFVRSSGYLTRLSDISLKTRLIKTRFWAWRAGIDGWNDSTKTVVFGWGPENFNTPFSKHFNPEFFAGIGSETLFDRAHNMFVEVLVTMGLVGLLSYLALFAILVWMLWRLYRRAPSNEDRLSAAVLLSGLMAYVIHNGFIFDTSANFIVFFIFMGLVHTLYRSVFVQPVSAAPVPRALPAVLRYSVALIAAILAVVSIFKTDIRPAQANYATTRAIVAGWSNDQPEALRKFKQALGYDTFPVYEIRHRYAQYVLENYGKFQQQKIDPGAALLDVIQKVQKNTDSPLDYLPYLYISRSYIILGKSDPASPFNDLALENSMRALEISPTFVRTYYEVAQAYLNKKDYEKALEYFQRAIDLNPDVGISWWYLGVATFDAGDANAGIAAIEKAIALGHALGEQDILRLVNLYAEQGNFVRVVALYEQLIGIKPTNAQYYASLAATYARLGRIDDAVKAAKAAANVDPSFEPEARTFVAGLGRSW